MTNLDVTISLAAESDAPTLASIMTAAFVNSDAAYRLIWSSDATHTDVAVKGLFNPVQKAGRLTFKAMTGERLVGFATWELPKPNALEKEDSLEKVEETSNPRGLPDIPGVNTKLWNEKVNRPRAAYERDMDTSKDMLLHYFFVHPNYQRRGIGTLLLQWGLSKADESKAKIWLTSTPQAIATYEKNGWGVVECYDVDLESYGGSGIYSRAWMLRQPMQTA